jgi:hypothetical protein
VRGSSSLPATASSGAMKVDRMMLPFINDFIKKQEPNVKNALWNQKEKEEGKGKKTELPSIVVHRRPYRWDTDITVDMSEAWDDFAKVPRSYPP